MTETQPPWEPRRWLRAVNDAIRDHRKPGDPAPDTIRLVARERSYYIDHSTGANCSASKQTIAEAIDRTDRTVYTVDAWLVAHGLMRHDGYRSFGDETKRTKVYTLTYPEPETRPEIEPEMRPETRPEMATEPEIDPLEPEIETTEPEMHGFRQPSLTPTVREGVGKVRDRSEPPPSHDGGDPSLRGEGDGLTDEWSRRFTEALPEPFAPWPDSKTATTEVTRLMVEGWTPEGLAAKVTRPTDTLDPPNQPIGALVWRLREVKGGPATEAAETTPAEIETGDQNDGDYWTAQLTGGHVTDEETVMGAFLDRAVDPYREVERGHTEMVIYGLNPHRMTPFQAALMEPAKRLGWLRADLDDDGNDIAVLRVGKMVEAVPEIGHHFPRGEAGGLARWDATQARLAEIAR